MMRSVFILASVLLSVSVPAQTAIQLIGRNTGSKVLHDGNSIRTFGFAQNFGENPGVPGPTLEFTEGDSVILDFWNISQGAPHTIHLHGLDVNQENDGVPHLSFEVHHNEHGYYRFRAPHAGTYLYHCHVVSSIHVQAGMYGLIVVHPSDTAVAWSGGPEIHADHNLMFSEIDTIWHHDSVLLHEYDTNMNHHPVPIPVYDPQHFLINGLSEQQLDGEVEITGKANSSIYLRLANIGFMSNLIEFPTALHAQIVSSDGRPLPVVESANSLEIFPGERYGVILKPTEEFTDEVAVKYVNLNTHQVENTQSIDVRISGYLGIEPLAEPELTVSPNPSTGNIRLIVRGDLPPSNGVLTIHSVDGKTTASHKVDLGHMGEINLQGLAAGVYILQLQWNNQILTQRLVLQ